MEQRIVILGAGYAGVLTAKKLAKRFKNDRDVTITLIDRHKYHTMLTELHEVAAHRVPEDSIKISLSRVFAGRRVNVVHDSIGTVDYDKKILTGKIARYPYDYLVLATGSQPAFFGIPGADAHTFRLWSYDDAVKLREHILCMFRKAAEETDMEKKRKYLTFYVIGAGLTGVEMAGELAEWARILCDSFEIGRENLKIVSVDMLDRVVPALPEKLSHKARRRMEKMGIRVKLKTGVKGVGEDYVELEEGGKINRYEAKTIIWTAGIEGSDVVKGAAGLNLEKKGRVKTNSFLQAEGRKEVFVAGDNLFYIPEGEDKPVPQMVENSEHSAETIAHNLSALVTKEGEMRSYRPVFHGVMLCIGSRYGLACIGGAKKKISLPSFFSMFVKHFINLVYFVQVLGWNKIFSYLYYEFFTVRDCRSFVGGHFSNRTPSFLLAPLRVYLGAYWVYEGIMKITEGWLTAPRLKTFLQSASTLFYQVITGTSASDAVSNATPAAGEAGAAAGKLLWDVGILGFIRFTVIQTSDIAVRFQMGLMDWFNNTFILSSDAAQIFFQIVIVLAEIGVGLLLMGGLFTTVAAAASIGLQGLFLMTTGLYRGTWWMLVAPIALLIGGGRIFGLDYYVMPYLKKLWKKVPFARRLYIYND